MAYPIIPDVARVQVRFQKNSGLPEDVFINTFYFRTATLNTVAENAASMATMLDAFYGDTFAPQSGSLGSLMPDVFQSIRYVFYDLGQATPRYPVVPSGSEDPFINASWSPPASGGAELPEETAICCSFAAGNGPRRRGRVFLGPWKDSVLETVNGHTRPTQNIRERIALASENMAASSQNATWVVVSPSDAGAYDVVSGWVDNAFDTQRSRGPAPTTRTTWSL